MPTTLDLGPSPPHQGRRERRVNWNVVTAVLTIVGWLLIAASGFFGDYRQIDNRVTTLESQRKNDTDRLDRIEDKIDRLLERPR